MRALAGRTDKRMNRHAARSHNHAVMLIRGDMRRGQGCGRLAVVVQRGLHILQARGGNIIVAVHRACFRVRDQYALLRPIGMFGIGRVPGDVPAGSAHGSRQFCCFRFFCLAGSILLRRVRVALRVRNLSFCVFAAPAQAKQTQGKASHYAFVCENFYSDGSCSEGFAAFSSSSRR